VSVVGVLVSGSGSNLQSLLDAARDGDLGAPVGLVLSNKPGVLALERARRAGVPAEVVPHGNFPSREAFDARLVERLRAHAVDTVVLAGFLRVVTAVLLDAFPGRVVNIHPSLLPAFPGMNAQAQALAHGVKVTGCTAHLVDAGLDSGPILVQRAVAVLPDDSVDSLRDRILAEEHRCLPEAVAALVAGRVALEGRRARVLPVAPRP
jgi:phosphoribosylglycinamide formyltransferase-1